MLEGHRQTGPLYLSLSYSLTAAMMSIKKIYPIILSCLITVSLVTADDPGSGVSKKVMNFVSYWNGVYDNNNQTQEPGDDHAFIQCRLVPVDIECFRPNPVLFGEEVIKGVVRFIFLAVVTDDIEDTVSLAVYNFTKQRNYKPREFNVETLSNMSCGDLQRVEGCTASYRVAKDYVYGNFPYCSYTVNGKHPRFISIHRCDSVTGTPPQNAEQPSPIEPYEFLYTKKFQVINPPQGYVAPCGPKADNITNQAASSS